jgi:hypothetical protein
VKAARPQQQAAEGSAEGDQPAPDPVADGPRRPPDQERDGKWSRMLLFTARGWAGFIRRV